MRNRRCANVHAAVRPPCLTVVALVLCVGDPDLLAQDDGQNTDARVAAEQSAHGLVRWLFTTLGNDLERLPSKDNATILLNGGIIAIAVSPFDEMGTHGFSSSTILKASFGGFGKALGREWVQGSGALAAYAWRPCAVRGKAELMGHDHVDTTLTVYAQVLDGAIRAAVDKVGSEGCPSTCSLRWIAQGILPAVACHERAFGSP